MQPPKHQMEMYTNQGQLDNLRVLLPQDIGKELYACFILDTTKIGVLL